MAIVDYFVSPALGSDSTGDGSLAKPWKTRQFAVNNLVWNTNGGVQLNIQAGAADVMTEAFTLPFTPDSNAPFVTRGYDNQANDGGIGEIDGAGQFSIDATQQAYCSFVDLKIGNTGSSGLLDVGVFCSAANSEIYGCQAAIPLQMAQSVGKFENCYMHDLGGNGCGECGEYIDCKIDLRGSGAGFAIQAGSRIEGNRIWVDGGTHGIATYAYGTVANNSIWSDHGSGIGIYAINLTDVSNNIVEGFSGSIGYGMLTLASFGAIRQFASNRVFNCAVAYQNATPEPLFDDGNNLVLTASPFIDPANGNLNLNNDPNGGALCGGNYSYPAGFQGGPRTQWRVIGAVQPAPPSPPATPSLTVADNGNGTGATATISGSQSGSTNTVTVTAIGTNGLRTWTNAGTCTGDGTVALSLVNGAYLAIVTSSVSGVVSSPSSAVQFLTSGGTSYTSVHKALAVAVQQKIQSMLGTSIIGVSADSVRVRKTAYLGDFSGKNPLPSNYAYSLPGIVICYFDVEEVADATNARDEIGYPITIVFAQETQSAATPSEANADQFLRWREAVERTFTHLRGCPNQIINATANGLNYQFFDCRMKGGLIIDPDRSIDKKIDVGWIKLSFLVWRGKNGT